MTIKHALSETWKFLKKDTWQSWIVSIILIIIGIKWVFFPIDSLITGALLPLVVIESCSMYHNTGFDNWWKDNAAWYESQGITKAEFENFPFENGLNKGDIIFVWGKGAYKQGDVIIFNAPTQYPIIHRLSSTSPLSTKGDNGFTNPGRLPNGLEENIAQEKVIGKAVGRIPFLGWVKLIFFEPSRAPSARGLCK